MLKIPSVRRFRKQKPAQLAQLEKDLPVKLLKYFSLLFAHGAPAIAKPGNSSWLAYSRIQTASASLSSHRSGLNLSRALWIMAPFSALPDPVANFFNVAECT